MQFSDTSILIIISSLIFISGCDTGPKSAKGFSLPEGDATQGEQTFVELKCHACHTVSDVKLPEVESELSIGLGGKVARIKTYGELVTSIINPSHRLAKGYPSAEIESDGQSKMKNYNEAMTVDQLINLVAFLQAHYELEEYTPTYYPVIP
ncbi:cytochrome C [Gimesia algae]|uniref:Cytochrome c domain-containing protein n=1 Tax=Gimesia algae TaxID=2527971 RepID=A0A517VEU0_9PLAN|nr:cytochrome C [Gimesia algae]QDT91520.1 hypothetical protein Pan161_31790 [Gimesia algae]